MIQSNNSEFSDYVIYVDESGDHGLNNIDKNHPIFVLAFCVFRKNDYIKKISPSIQQLKFDYFGHDSIILHSSDIRKSEGSFKKLFNQDLRESFLTSLNKVIDNANFNIFATIIDKIKLNEMHLNPENPYEIALRSCVESLHVFLKEKNQNNKKTHILIEGRGKKEDKDLGVAFKKIVKGDNFRNQYLFGLNLPFDINFTDKKINSGGLQIADLVAYPIAKKYLKPNQQNKSYDVVKNKFYDEESVVCLP